MSRDRPEAAAEALAEDRARTVAKPEALDSGPCELCVDQEVAPKADPPRHISQPEAPCTPRVSVTRPTGHVPTPSSAVRRQMTLR
jgi:hypothetical protein